MTMAPKSEERTGNRSLLVTFALCRRASRYVQGMKVDTASRKNGYVLAKSSSIRGSGEGLEIIRIPQERRRTSPLKVYI